MANQEKIKMSEEAKGIAVDFIFPRMRSVIDSMEQKYQTDAQPSIDDELRIVRLALSQLEKETKIEQNNNDSHPQVQEAPSPLPSTASLPAKSTQASLSKPVAPAAKTTQEVPPPTEIPQASLSGQVASTSAPTTQEEATTSQRGGLRKRKTVVQEKGEFALADEVFPQSSSKKKKTKNPKQKARKAAASGKEPKKKASIPVKTSQNMPRLINVTASANNSSRKFLIEEDGVRKEFTGWNIPINSNYLTVVCTSIAGKKAKGQKKCMGRHILKVLDPELMIEWHSFSDGRPGCKLNFHNESTLKRENYEIVESKQHTCYDEIPAQDKGATSEEDQAASPQAGDTMETVDLTLDTDEPDIKTEKEDSN